MVDARYFHRYPAKKIAFRQLAVADSVIVTKTEDFSFTEKEKFLQEIKNLNPLAGYHLSYLGHVSDFDLENIQHKMKFIRDFTIESAMHEHLQAKTIRFQNPLNKLEFTDWFSYTLDLYKTEIYRVKGILCFENEPFEYILQGVGGSFEITESEIFLTENISEMVFIGNLNMIELELSF
jgi:G3E family GTPase